MDDLRLNGGMSIMDQVCSLKPTSVRWCAVLTVAYHEVPEVQAELEVPFFLQFHAKLVDHERLVIRGAAVTHKGIIELAIILNGEMENEEMELE